MSESTQSVPATLASIRNRLFGPFHRQKEKSEKIEKTETTETTQRTVNQKRQSEEGQEQEQNQSEDPSTYNTVWKQRWDFAPDGWKRYITTIDKDFGLTKEEEAKIHTRNHNYVETANLTPRARAGSSAIMLTVGSMSKLLLASLNKLHTHNMQTLYDAIENREARNGLLTFSNHQSVLDDPFLMGAILPPRILANAQKMRWGLCSLDICFQDAFTSRVLRLGKALPIERRGGIKQSFLRTAGEKLRRGDWVHIFPEGRVRQMGMGYSKRGTGKLLAMAYETNGRLPLIIPMYHEGIEKVMPQKPDSNQLQSMIPRRGQKLFVVVGDPVDVRHIFDRLMPDCQAAGGTARDEAPCLRLYEQVADFMGVVMRLLRAEARQRIREEHDIDLGSPYEYS